MSITKVDELLTLPGWETRKKIIDSLQEGPKTAYELSKELNINYSTARYHLELLQKFGLVNIRKGRKYYYELTKNAKLLLRDY
ncbi:ArsR/SmtB family transcription factor [Stygiolobus caldivivus]|uniref:Transcriptional regulator n=1 Tax=Stygiolobus caldivivus TaxID=2824673 RepID=A0A8D5U4I9_9CREN|nr:winged helix-turn-helix domain-containing protein [Stygiolobus caldivivus]BCU69281.1 transcriptional regulator [Stygiolobus caldivivus]